MKSVKHKVQRPIDNRKRNSFSADLFQKLTILSATQDAEDIAEWITEYRPTQQYVHLSYRVVNLVIVRKFDLMMGSTRNWRICQSQNQIESNQPFYRR